jgi:hypothetical protein
MATKVATRKAQVFDYESFGKALKTKRTIEHNYSIRDVADIVQMPNSTISRMERSLGSDMKSILVVCDWLGRSLCDFIIYEKAEAFPIIMDGTVVLKAVPPRHHKKKIK